jgi:chromosome partitioning protein
MARTIAVANQKGGVGKTATAVNLGAALALLGRRVLVVELDSQGSATSGLGAERRRGASSYEVLLDDLPARQAVQPTSVSGLFVLPATRDLAGAEVELVSLEDRHARLRKQLEPLREEFDFILIDCPPALGMLTLNALCAADAVVVPLQCEFYALEGLGALVDTLERVRSAYQAELSILGVLLTMHDARTSLSRQVAAEVRAHFGARVFEATIPRNVRVSESPSHGQSVVTYDPASAGAIAYMQAAREILQRVEGTGELVSATERPVAEEEDDETTVG